MRKCRVVIATYSWSHDIMPRLKSCHVIEDPKKLVLRLGYKLNHRNQLFVHYVLMPVEKIDLKYTDEVMYDIQGYPNWHSLHRYPFESFYRIGGDFEGHCKIVWESEL
jgi:hypothetical protein